MKLVDLLRTLVENNGSDLHILAGLQPAIRINGRLKPIEGLEKLSPHMTKELIYGVLDDFQKKTFETNCMQRGELDFALGVPGLGRFRVNVHLQRGTVAATIRALTSSIPKIDDLGLPESVKKFAQARNGLILVTGPTGCGKSTTLAALLDIINSSREDHIITIEDPIEYVHNSKMSYVTQREVGPLGDSLSFKNALKYALRQDPDVIMIGEMRDYETIGIALTSAETGHLVFGTLHTSSAAKTVSRVIDVFPVDQQPLIRTQLASHLVGVVSQILLPSKNGEGRCVAAEVLMTNPAVRNNIRSGKIDSIYQTLQTSRSEGMVTLDYSLTQLCREGKIDYETACPYIQDQSTHQVLTQFGSGNSQAASPHSHASRPQ